MVVPCCRDRACEVQCGSLLCPARHSGATPQCSFRAVAMPPAVKKAQVGSLSLGLGFGSIWIRIAFELHFSFHSVFVAVDSENLDLNPRLANC